MNLICKHSIISVTFKSEFKFNPRLSYKDSFVFEREQTVQLVQHDRFRPLSVPDRLTFFLRFSGLKNVTKD